MAKKRRVTAPPAKAAAGAKAARKATPARARKSSKSIATVQVEELESMRAEVERLAQRAAPPRWNADPDDVRRSVAKLVLTLVEFIRQLL